MPRHLRAMPAGSIMCRRGGGMECIMSFRVVARDCIKPECREEAFKLLEEMIAKTKEEPGNISYVYCKDVKDPDHFAMIEEWKDKDALEAHMKSEHFNYYIPKLSQMMAGPSRLEVYEEFIK